MVNFNDVKIKVSLIILIVVFSFASIIIFLRQEKRNATKNDNNVVTESELPQNEVLITDNGFEPAFIKIKSNTVVVWHNKTDSAASINSDPHPSHTNYSPLNLGTVDATGATQLHFYDKGTYPYHNHYNPDQRGVVVVE